MDLEPDVPRRRFTTGEVLRMVEAGILSPDEHVELLAGELVLVSPQGPPHAALVGEVARLLAEIAGRSFCLRIQAPLEAGSDSLPEPDVCLVPGAPRDYLARHPAAAEALLAFEIAVTELAAARRKLRVYARAGLPVCRILNVAARRLEIHEEPSRSGRYRRQQVLSERESVAVPGLGATIEVARMLP